MARFMAHFRERSRVARKRPLTILVATSGDTGSAVAQAFHRVAQTEVVILYPKGQVSRLQERQFTTLGDNVRAFAVGGTFDDCQRLVKEAFRDAELAAALDLTSANSINIGRLLPQMVYYAVAAVALPPRPQVVVPSSKFGNLAAGLLARRLGVPLGPFLAATNANSVVPEYLAGGDSGRVRHGPRCRTRWTSAIPATGCASRRCSAATARRLPARWRGRASTTRARSRASPTPTVATATCSILMAPSAGSRSSVSGRGWRRQSGVALPSS